MLRVLTIAVVLVCAAWGAASAANDDAKREKILRLIAMDGAETVVDQVIAQRLPAVRQQVALKHPNLPPEALEAYVSAFAEEMRARRREFVSLIVPVYDRLFTADEVDQLLAFYESDVGRKLRASTDDILTEARKAGMAWGERNGAAVAAVARARVEARGFKFE
jgi:hypothetical protein